MKTATPQASLPAAVPRTQRADGELARERLLQAALRLFAEHGYAKTSIRQIALAAQANVAAVSYYFGDKAGLYRAVYCCVPKRSAPNGDVTLDAQPGTPATSLTGLFAQFLEPLKHGEQVRLWMKLHRREMLEPTGVWKEKLDNGIRPMHAALVALLCDRLGLAAPDDEVHRLAISIAGLAVHLFIGCDVIEALAPQLTKGPDAMDLWRQRLLTYAEAMIAAEVRRRARPLRAAAAARQVNRTMNRKPKGAS
ncbi:MAG: CerR family C-terminal domain-containing protein [Proteobacteria bacterium]|nr:CerR family C-terminal domain-containing protein [Pseudomonadota bacterium]